MASVWSRTFCLTCSLKQVTSSLKTPYSVSESPVHVASHPTVISFISPSPCYLNFSGPTCWARPATSLVLSRQVVRGELLNLCATPN